MIKSLRFVKREVSNGDGSASTRMILQQLVPMMELAQNSTGGNTILHGEEWQDVPYEENM